MEKQMRKICNDTQSNDYKALLLAHLFWSIFDEVFYCNRANIFKHLYMSPKHYEVTYLKTSLEFNINLRTLERYRKIFVLSFKAALSLIKNINTIFEVA